MSSPDGTVITDSTAFSHRSARIGFGGRINVPNASSNSRVLAVANFNGYGKADILWHNPKTDQVAVWLMNETKLVSAGSAIQGAKNEGWKVAGREAFRQP